MRGEHVVGCGACEYLARCRGVESSGVGVPCLASVERILDGCTLCGTGDADGGLVEERSLGGSDHGECHTVDGLRCCEVDHRLVIVVGEHVACELPCFGVTLGDGGECRVDGVCVALGVGSVALGHGDSEECGGRGGSDGIAFVLVEQLGVGVDLMERSGVLAVSDEHDVGEILALFGLGRSGGHHGEITLLVGGHHRSLGSGHHFQMLAEVVEILGVVAPATSASVLTSEASLLRVSVVMRSPARYPGRSGHLNATVVLWVSNPASFAAS